jgi:radical SAM protein with 4Fe4S-binding SPASM domain
MRTGPDYIQFYPTLRCNQACEFCFNRNMPQAPDIPLKQIRIMLRTLARLGIKTLDIMGGEPTLHGDLVGCIREARESGVSVNISSNGSHPRLLAEIMTGFPWVTVGISINDRQTLEATREFIGRYKPVVKSVFSPRMDRELIASVFLLKPQKYYLIYRDALDRRELTSTLPFYEFAATAGKSFGSGQAGMVFCSGFVPDSDASPELSHVRCPAGTTKLGVMPDGSVYPCNLWFGKKEFLLGNILSDSFDSIWNHPALAYFRSVPEDICPKKSCELHSRCHGGCPAHSFAYTGTLSAPDPRCCG